MSTQPENKNNAGPKISKDELSDKDAEKVTGGSRSTSTPSISEIVVTKRTDSSSP